MYKHDKIQIQEANSFLFSSVLIDRRRIFFLYFHR